MSSIVIPGNVTSGSSQKKRYRINVAESDISHTPIFDFNFNDWDFPNNYNNGIYELVYNPAYDYEGFDAQKWNEYILNKICIVDFTAIADYNNENVDAMLVFNNALMINGNIITMGSPYPEQDYEYTCMIGFNLNFPSDGQFDIYVNFALADTYYFINQFSSAEKLNIKDASIKIYSPYIEI